METGFDVIGSIAIGIFLGFIANSLPKRHKVGLFANFAIGMIGNFVGSFVLNLCRLEYNSFMSSILIGYATSAIVATIFLYIAFMINRQQQG